MKSHGNIAGNDEAPTPTELTGSRPVNSTTAQLPTLNDTLEDAIAKMRVYQAANPRPQGDTPWKALPEVPPEAIAQQPWFNAIKDSIPCKAPPAHPPLTHMTDDQQQAYAELMEREVHQATSILINNPPPGQALIDTGCQEGVIGLAQVEELKKHHLRPSWADLSEESSDLEQDSAEAPPVPDQVQFVAVAKSTVAKKKKITVCSWFKKGNCKNGEHCRYDHDPKAVCSVCHTAQGDETFPLDKCRKCGEDPSGHHGRCCHDDDAEAQVAPTESTPDNEQLQIGAV